MKFFHLSDLHLGKRLHEASLLEDQAYILSSILTLARQECPDCVVIAGDIYDKSLPSEEAVHLLDDFLSRLTALSIPVLMISGNHDSQERLAFGARLMQQSGVYIAGTYQPAQPPVTLCDEHGPVDFFLLPFVKPYQVRHHFPEEDIKTVDDALACAVRSLPRRDGRRSVLVMHQFVLGGKPGGSEDDALLMSVGGSEQVGTQHLQAFDYVALGHLHNPHSVGAPNIRYCGTPLKYDFSEAAFAKSVTIVEMDQDGHAKVRTAPLTPMRDLLDLRGTFEELTAPDFLAGISRDAYTRITLLDEDEIPNAAARLHFHYPNLLSIHIENSRYVPCDAPAAPAAQQTPLSLAEQFYRRQTGQELSAQQADYLSRILEQLKEEEV